MKGRKRWRRRSLTFGIKRIKVSEIWVSRYELRAVGALNARSSRTTFRGALIRKGSGFGCLHPWPELGDPSLEECLKDWTLPNSRQALACALADGKAREKGVSLFEGLTVPRSHATLPSVSGEAVEQAIAAGFSTVKIKMKGELGQALELMNAFPNLRWRVDFNGTANLTKLAREVHGVKNLLDFIEDPVPFDSEIWRRFENETGVLLANDRAAEDFDHGIQIIKPAVNEIDPLMQRAGRKIVTSYMDHPLGQCFASYESARVGMSETCGLQTHGLFESNPFTEVLGAPGPEFSLPGGTGLGFDELLQGLTWEKLA